LKKEGEKTYIGLHAVGEPNSEWEVYSFDGSVTKKKGFRAWESWGNEYLDGEMVGRGSFRVFDDIETVAENLEKDGWERFILVNECGAV
jgi:hypothetical protein